MQTLWKPKIAWDEPLEAELHNEWKAASDHSDEVLFSPNHQSQSVWRCSIHCQAK